MNVRGPAEVQDLVDTIAAATGAPTVLEDRDLHLVASSQQEGPLDAVRRESVLRRRSSAAVQEQFAAFGIARAEEPLRIPARPETGLLPRWCVPVRWRAVTYGYLWLLDPDGRVDAGTLAELAEAVEQVAALLAARARLRDRTTWAVGGLLAEDAGERARAAEELQRDALLPPGGVRVVALAPRGAVTTGPVNGWVLPRGVLSAAVGGRAALVVPDDEGAGPAAGRAAGRAANALLAQHPAGVAAGISGDVALTDGHRGWRQATAALRAALAGPGPVVTLREWGVLGVDRLRALADPATLASTVTDDRTARLLAGDPELVRTARTWLDLAGSVGRTAAALSVHRQTLYARLRRIEAETGLDLTDGRDRLALHVALVLTGPD
ncbi:PucR family transcriptional regulator [Kineococcus gynurae]|uniref:PucR family transcriptional regulator n=1 Tax=Kineococcus gynurae TaxID=452979 RepID=A0ABV5LT46_9ACTN